MKKLKMEPVVSEKMKILFLDIETAPNLVYSWGLWNQNISINQIVKPSHILCWAAKWYGEKETHFGSIEDQSQEQMLLGIWNMLNKADVVVTYNGKKFDLPRLNNEFRKCGFPPPSPFRQVDLYRVVKANFDLPSHKLEYVVKYFGVGRKIKTVGMELWLGCMSNDPACWADMELYNRGDVKLTERLYKHILPWISNHPNHGLYNGHELACPNCGGTKVQRRGVLRTSTQIYQRFQCMSPSCGKWSRGKKNITREHFEHPTPGTLRG